MVNVGTYTAYILCIECLGWLISRTKSINKHGISTPSQTAKFTNFEGSNFSENSQNIGISKASFRLLKKNMTTSIHMDKKTGFSPFAPEKTRFEVVFSKKNSLRSMDLHQGTSKSRWHSYHVLVYISPVLTYLLGTVSHVLWPWGKWIVIVIPTASFGGTLPLAPQTRRQESPPRFFGCNALVAKRKNHRRVVGFF